MRVIQRNGLSTTDSGKEHKCRLIDEAADKQRQWREDFGEFHEASLGDWDTPVVSVIVPVYNYADKLSNAVDSVLKQSYPHWELVLVDDGSTDESWSVIQQVSAADERVKAIKQPNMGLSAARNSGIRASSGDFICLLDPDDTYREDKLMRQVEFMYEHPYLGMSYANAMLHANGQEHPTTCPRFDRDLLLRANIIPCQSVIMRRSAVDVVGPFNEAMEEVEDYEYWVRIAEYFGIARIPDFISYDIFQHSEQKSVVAQKERPEQWRELHARISHWGKYRQATQLPLVSVVTTCERAMLSTRLQTLPYVECVRGTERARGIFMTTIPNGWRFSSPHDLANMMWDTGITVKEVTDATGRITLHRNPRLFASNVMPLVIKVCDEASASRSE